MSLAQLVPCTNTTTTMLSMPSNSPVETQHLCENENQNHADEDARLAHKRTHALVRSDGCRVQGGGPTYGVADDSNGIACSQARQAD